MSEKEFPISANQPNKSFWVSANAGSGKTNNLVLRVARLLLMGVRPEKILCLTFTTAAANEMKDRLLHELGSWSMLSEDDLYNKLKNYDYGLHFRNSKKSIVLKHARHLFAEVLDTPGGLKVQTIHSFCTSVLKKFPLEVNLTPNFTILDETRQFEIINRAISYLAKNNNDIFEKVISQLRIFDLSDFIRQVLSFRTTLSLDFDAEGFCGNFNLKSTKIDPSSELAAVLKNLPIGIIKTITRDLLKGSKNDKLLGEKFKNFHLRNPQDKLDILESVFCTKDGKLRSSKSFPSKLAKSLDPNLENNIQIIKKNFLSYIERRNDASIFQKTEILYQFSNLFLKFYEGVKKLENAVDYDDLIIKTNILLNDYEAKWVQYKLDGGIDHILLDEAQDTSRNQWRMLASLLDDFFVDDRISKGHRTLYAVGDEKQSIYSFQGADIKAFGKMKNFFSQKMISLGDQIHDFHLLKSFRSSEAILNFVNEIFSNGGETGVKKIEKHQAFYARLPGRVELWPKVVPQKKEKKNAWWELKKNSIDFSSAEKLAKSIANEVKNLLRTKAKIAFITSEKKIQKRQVVPGDFLILVRSRGVLFDCILKEFKDYKLPVAGSDRIFLLEELAVRDLISLLRFLNNPVDDLSLAEALKSPLFGFSEQMLFNVSFRRKSSLYQSLNSIYPEHKSSLILQDLLRCARSMTPYEMLQRFLVNYDGRLKIVSRFGTVVDDILDEFLLLTLRYEDTEIPSVHGFLNWLENYDLSIKRQYSSRSSVIRIMTIHGAKGLESPIVILTDSPKKVHGPRPTKILEKKGWVCFSDRNEFMPYHLQKIKNEELQETVEEENRLLYVAITRAKNWLIICGYTDNFSFKQSESSDTSWFGKSQTALVNLKRSQNHDFSYVQDTKLVYELFETDKFVERIEVKEEVSTIQALSKIKQNDYSNFRGRSEFYVGEQRLSVTQVGYEPTPKQASDTETSRNSKVSPESKALYGTLVHLFLQYLNKFREEDYSYLKKMVFNQFFAKNEDLELIDEAFREALNVLRDPRLSYFFDHRNSLFELSIAGVLDLKRQFGIKNHGSKLFLGRVDFLHVTKKTVRLIDFKSEDNIPENIQFVKTRHLAQIALYTSLIENAYPGREVIPSILWTKKPVLMNIPKKNAVDAVKMVLQAEA